MSRLLDRSAAHRCVALPPLRRHASASPNPEGGGRHSPVAGETPLAAFRTLRPRESGHYQRKRPANPVLCDA